MPEEKKTERVTIMMTPSAVDAIDEWSFAHRIRSRGEAFRRLAEIGLETSKQLPAKRPVIKRQPTR
jgi:hypothetical protein